MSKGEQDERGKTVQAQVIELRERCRMLSETLELVKGERDAAKAETVAAVEKARTDIEALGIAKTQEIEAKDVEIKQAREEARIAAEKLAASEQAKQVAESTVTTLRAELAQAAKTLAVPAYADAAATGFDAAAKTDVPHIAGGHDANESGKEKPGLREQLAKLTDPRARSKFIMEHGAAMTAEYQAELAAQADGQE